MMSRQIAFYLARISDQFGEKVSCLGKLKGGFSPSDNYLLQVKEEKYVLRVFNRKSSAELKVAIAAADERISPPVFWIAEDESAYLMKYIEDAAFSLEIAKKPKNIAMIAHSFRKIHGLSQEGIPHRSVYKDLKEKYSKLKSLGLSSEKSEKAMREIEEDYLAKGVGEEDWVVIHGDLTPRNEFFDGTNLIIIDWDEVNLENRFYDLSLFALMHNYTHSEEELLLKEYFKTPIDPRWDEYKLCKKIISYVFYRNDSICSATGFRKQNSIRYTSSPMGDLY